MAKTTTIYGLLRGLNRDRNSQKDILIENFELATRFEAHFELLKGAGDGFTQALLDSNNSPKRRIPLGAARIDSWFSKLSREIDIEELVELVKGARQGIFFVMFQPGNEPVRTLLRMQPMTTNLLCARPRGARKRSWQPVSIPVAQSKMAAPAHHR